MWLLAVFLLLLSPLFFNRKLAKKWNALAITCTAAFNFIFRMSSEDRVDALRKIHHLYPRFLHIDCFKLRVLLVYDPEIARRIFTSPHTLQRPFRSFVPLEKGLLFSSYADWREPRKHLNLAFNLAVLKGFIPIFSEYARITVRDITDQHVDGDEFNLLRFVAQLVFRTNSATILNVHRSELSAFEELYDSINTLGECLFERMSNPLYHADFVYQLTSSYVREQKAVGFLMSYGNGLIDEARRRHRKTLLNVDENENVVGGDEDVSEPRAKINFIVDQLINHEQKFSDREIRDQLLTLLITASDTTMNLVAACGIFMAMNQDVQQKVYDEIVDVFGDDFTMDYERVNDLKYLEMVLKETLRLFSPIPIMLREAIDDCHVGTGKTLKKGTKIVILDYILHQRKDIWGKDARKFDPENFSSEKTSERDPYVFVPFGSGLRNCIGHRYTMIAAKVFIVELIKAFKFKTSLTERGMKMKMSFTSKLASDYLVSVESR